MHKFAKQIMDCVKAHVDGIGIENFEGQNLDDLKDWTEIAKNIVCFDKDYRIVEAMEKSEDNEEIMRMIEEYEDYPERRFYDSYRYKTTGRYAPKGRGTYVGRRGYEEPPYMHMMNREDLQDWDSMSERERMRDLDRASRGRMYYTETEPMHKDGGMRDSREGKAGMMRKGYMETKEMHKGSTPQDKEANMRSLEEYLKELSEDLTGLLSDMTPEERQMAKTKITTLAAKM
jgi:hypothetical protein